MSTVKYFYTPIYAYMIGLDYWGTMFSMIIGGVLGFLIYYHISKILIVSTRHLTPIANVIVPYHLRKRYNNYKHKRRLRRKNKKIFTKRNRRLVKLGKNYGMYTIIFFTPIVISLILGAFLLRRYYGNRREAVPLMIVSIIVEGAILITIYWYIMGDL
ncbi:MAG: hypothetical protein QM503_14635 [Bacteroidota bacterium]